MDYGLSYSGGIPVHGPQLSKTMDSSGSKGRVLQDPGIIPSPSITPTLIDKCPILLPFAVGVKVN